MTCSKLRAGIEMMEAALEEFGLVREEKRPSSNGVREDGDSPYDRLNDHAMKNMAMWVLDLGIYKCRRRRGPHASYEGVAQWRRSTTHGDDIDKRDPNLKISPLGIKDFGDNRTYTPLNLVMAAKNYDLNTAFDWLAEKTGFSLDGPEIDLNAIKAKQAEQDVRPDPANGTADGQAKADHSETDFEQVPSWWGVGGWVSTNPPPPQPWIVQGTVPLVGVGLISGQTGAAKTWLSVHLSACVLMGRSFAGLHTDHPGGVLYFEVENSTVDIRIRAACSELGGDATKLPFLLNETIGPLLNRRRPDKREVELLRKKIAWAKGAMLARHGAPLRLVFLDTLTSIAGIEDHDDTAENAAFMGICSDLAKEFEVFVIINDHFGKSIEAGTRGSSAKEARADVVLAVIGKPDQADDEPRKVRWRKMRNAHSGRETQFRLRRVDVEVGGVLVSTRAVEFLLDTEGMKEAPSGRGKPLSDEQRMALNLLTDCSKRAPAIIPPGHEPAGIKGTMISVWREAWDNYHATVHGAGQAARCRKTWARLVPTLKLANAINMDKGVVWVPSAFGVQP
jgi:hypothetical protein